MNYPHFISAICTPLDEQESLHEEGLEAHIEDQFSAGVHGLLVAGSMGLMQMLTDETYRQLVRRSVEIAQGRGEVMVGIGDTSLARSKERLQFVNQLSVDAVVVLTPFLFKHSQEDLVAYYRALADESKHPLYLYDLPWLTGVKLQTELIEQIADHPNIAGMKASCEIEWSRELIHQMGDRFRVIVAQPRITAELIGEGICHQLDGVFALAPQWTTALGNAAAEGDMETAGRYQDKLNAMLEVLIEYGVSPTASVILNARGMPGKHFAAPQRPLSDEARRAVLESPIICELAQTQAQSTGVAG